MRVHRFYTGQGIKLKNDFWLRDEVILWQWNKVLRFREGQETVLFDGEGTDRLYRITKISKAEAHLEMITELERKLPEYHIYIFWSLLKKDNNDFIIQKCTELGVSNFCPLIAGHSITSNFNIERARKIAREASEQCGRSNIPVVREPMRLETALKEYEEKIRLLVCQQGSSNILTLKPKEKYGLLIGPEGGWSENEKQLFEAKKIPSLHLGEFTLRAETAAIIATSRLI